MDPGANLGTLAAICAPCSDRDVQDHLARWMRAPPSPFTTAQRSRYGHLCARRNGLIRRVPHIERYELTDERRRGAVFFTKTYTTIVNPFARKTGPATTR